jgi:filamentous hemagglutinin family protein
MKKLIVKRSFLSAMVGACSLSMQQTQASGIEAVNTAQTQVKIGSNGAAMIQIATPNAQGLSHNQYQQFNVSAAGAALNNMTSGVAANPNLRGQAASIILNEVVGNEQSLLEGKIGILGNKAEFILANPNGIDCNGCGFINMSSATLTTGIPEIDSQGQLTGFQLNGGNVHIGQQGINVENVDYFKVIASHFNNEGTIKGVKLDAQGHKIKAADVEIKLAKQGRYDLETGQLVDTSSDSSGVIDAAQLGSISANKILISAKGNIGVSLPKDGTIIALSKLDMNAIKITNEGMISADSFEIETKNLENFGLMYANKTSSIIADEATLSKGTRSKGATLGVDRGKLSIETDKLTLIYSDLIGNVDIDAKEVVFDSVQHKASGRNTTPEKVITKATNVTFKGKNKFDDLQLRVKEKVIVKGGKTNLGHGLFDVNELVVENGYQDRQTLYVDDAIFGINYLTGVVYTRKSNVLPSKNTERLDFNRDDNVYYKMDNINASENLAIDLPRKFSESLMRKWIKLENKGYVTFVVSELEEGSFVGKDYVINIPYQLKVQDTVGFAKRNSLVANWVSVRLPRGVEAGGDVIIFNVDGGSVLSKVKAGGQFISFTKGLYVEGMVEADEVVIRADERLRVRTEILYVDGGRREHHYSTNKYKKDGIDWVETVHTVDSSKMYDVDKMNRNKTTIRSNKGMTLIVGDLENNFADIKSAGDMSIFVDGDYTYYRTKAHKEITRKGTYTTTKRRCNGFGWNCWTKTYVHDVEPESETFDITPYNTLTSTIEAAGSITTDIADGYGYYKENTYVSKSLSLPFVVDQPSAMQASEVSRAFNYTEAEINGLANQYRTDI